MIFPHGDSCLCCNRGDGGSDVGASSGGAGSGGAGSDGAGSGAAGASNAHTLLSIQ